METINQIELTDESLFPDEQVLQNVLGKSYSAYCDLLKLYGDYGLTYTWRYYRDGKAWLCKVQKKKRTIVWMSAWKGYMQVCVYIPLKYIDDVYALNISTKQITKIKDTKNVGKSKPCIFEIRDKKKFSDFEKLVQFKINNK